MSNDTPLPLPIPPMLEAALGYDGPARFVAFFWSPAGDEARYADGRIEADADWYAFRVLLDAPAVAVALTAFDLGSSDSVATHWLMLDRETRQLTVAPVTAARAALRAQWTPLDTLPFTPDSDGSSLDFTELLPALPRVEVHAAMLRQQELTVALQRWLLENLPAPTRVAQADMLTQIRARLALTFKNSSQDEL